MGGGSGGEGTVFVFTSSGIKTIYSFPDDEHGALEPASPLVVRHGALFGTTDSGGAYRYGTVYEVTTAGQESVIHSFGGNDSDGKSPSSGLISVGNHLYGTTYEGGITGRSDSGYDGYGTVFEIDPAGTERVLYRFDYSGKAGVAPRAGLVYLNGRLYGTTSAGAAHGNGAIFSLKRSGEDLQVLNAFPGSLTSAFGSSTLIVNGDALYGTTARGGTDEAGTLFRQTL